MKMDFFSFRKSKKILFFLLIGFYSFEAPALACPCYQDEESYWFENSRIKGERLWEILPSNSLEKKEADDFFRGFIERDSKNTEFQVDLAACYYYGKGISVDYVRAFSLLNQNRFRDDGRCLGLLGLCYVFGQGCSSNEEKAHSFFIEGAQKGNPESLNMLGLSNQFGIRKKKNLVKAFGYFKTASEKGFPEAQTNLGFFYFEGLGASRDITKVISLYKSAASHGSSGAQNNLAVCYEEGKGLKKNMMKAFHLYRQSAKQGDHAGQVNLGAFYLLGKGSTPVNRSKGIKYIKQAAEQKDQRAQAILIDLGEAPMKGFSHICA